MQLNVKVQATAVYQGSGNGMLTVTNVTSQPLQSWEIKFTCKNFKIGSVWQASSTMQDTVCIIRSASWSPLLAPGATFSSGFDYTGSAPLLIDNNVGTNAIINGLAPGQQPTPPPPKPLPSGPGAIAGYHVEWNVYRAAKYDLNAMPKQVNRVMYAFYAANPSQADYNVLKSKYEFPMQVYTPPEQGVPEGTLVPEDTNANSILIPQMQKLKQDRPDVLLGIAIGGWSHSWNLGKIFANPAATQALVQSSAKLLVDLGFDVLELDWESPMGSPAPDYNLPTPNDDKNLLNFVKLMKAELSKHNLLLGAAIAANKTVIDCYVPCIPYLDYINLMAYDYYGATFSETGGHHAGLFQNPKQPLPVPFFNVDEAVRYVLGKGCPPSKLVMGVPAYGRGWAKLTPPADPTIPPIFGVSNKVGAKEYDDGATPGVSSWKSLSTAPQIKESFDELAQASYSFNPATGEAWSFETPTSARRKATYIAQFGLAGAAIWDLTQDSLDPNKSLVVALSSTPPIPPPPPQPVPALLLSNTGSGTYSLPAGAQQAFSRGLVLTNTSSSAFTLVPSSSVSLL